MAESATELIDRPAKDSAAARQPEIADPYQPDAADPQPDEVIAADLLVEEISIDGMCGVY